MAALADDDDLAAQLVAARDDAAAGKQKPKRAIVDWSAEVEMLTALYDRVGELIQAVVASSGVKPRQVPPGPRPTTAMDRVSTTSRRSKHEALVARVAPHCRPNPTSARVTDRADQ